MTCIVTSERGYYFQVGVEVVVEGGEAVTKSSCHLVGEVVGGCIGGGV